MIRARPLSVSIYNRERSTGSERNVTYFAGKVGFCVNCGADPLVGVPSGPGRPRPALASKNQAPAIIEEPARGPAGPEGTPEGVRPTK
jgi:hypothetical protein